MDGMTPFDSSAPVEPIAAPPAESGMRGFLNSRNGKIVIGVALGLVVLGLVGYFVMTFFLDQSSDDLAVVPPTKPPVSSTTASGPAGPPEEVPIEDVFTFRDVFVPTIKVSDVPSSGAGTPGSGTTSGTATQPNTLTLAAIESENGKPVAVLTWNNQTYRLNEGESITGTPWKVLSINSSSVTMLYGDASVTLSVGQGISK